MRPPRRWIVLGLLLLVSLLLAWFAPDPETIESPLGDIATVGALSDARRLRAAPQLPLLRDWPPPRDLPVLPEAPPNKPNVGHGLDASVAILSAEMAAAAPAKDAVRLPYSFVGRMTLEGQQSVFLGHKGATLAAREGEVLEGGWRLEGVFADHLEFTHLATNLSQSLTIPAP